MEDLDVTIDKTRILKDDSVKGDGSRNLANRGPVNFASRWLEFYITTEGPYVAVYKEQCLTLIVSKKILNGQNLHGLCPIPDTPTDSKTASEWKTDFIAFGGRFLTRITLQVDSETMLVDIVHDSKVGALGDWIWDVRAFSNGTQVALLSHNQLARFNGTEEVPFFDECTTDAVKFTHCAVQCILYSGQIIGSQPNKLIVAAGTVFSGVLLWDGQTGELLYVLEEHQGVIFSVAVYMNEGLIVSTSDDRSARIYRFEKKSSNGGGETIADDSIVNVGALYGHDCRVWRTALIQKNILTAGEDGYLCLWDSFSGKLLGRRLVPGGGSVSALLTSGERVVIGGMAGSLSVINIKSLTLTGFPTDSTWKMRLLPKEGSVKCVSIDGFNMVVSTTAGIYMLSRLDSDLHDWTHTFHLQECADYHVVSQRWGYLFTANMYSFLWSFAVADQLVIWDRQCMQKGRSYSLICFENPFAGYLQVLSTGLRGNMFVMRFCVQQKSLIMVKSLMLPIGFERCATCALQISLDQILVGDRVGNVFLYSLDPAERSTPLSALVCLHGCNGTTDLARDSQNRILSAGRDGNVYELTLQNGQLVCLRVFWQHPAIEWVGRILRFRDRLLLACYMSGDFMLHDINSEYTLLSVAASGGHRAWDCGIDRDRFYYARVHKQNVVVDSISLVKRLAHIPIAAIHTKKINCAVTLWHINEQDVVATGGEDNLLVISVITGCQIIEPTVRLYEHISSVKSIAVCDLLNDRFMVSVGGRGQLIAWWVNVDLSVKMMSKHFIWNTDRTDSKKPWKNTSHKVKTDALTRYMSVNVRPEEDARSTPRFRILASGSDTIVRLFSYSIGGNIEPTHTIEGGAFCQLKTRWLTKNTFLATTTDGLVTLYSLQSSSTSPTSTSTADAEASSGTAPTSSASPVASMGSAKIHQSGVNALDVRGSLMATGGDDNAITLSRLTTDGAKDVVEVISKLENAHATQVTGMLWIDDDRLLSTSIDQRVTLWKVVEGEELQPMWTKMTAVADVSGFTPLADNRHVLIIGQGLEVVAIA
ncbi:WD repeat-containing protein 6-like, partial [Tropilaelaps mercedesae]